LSAADLNGDLYVDVVVALKGMSRGTVLKNVGGALETAHQVPVGASPVGVTAVEAGPAGPLGPLDLNKAEAGAPLLYEFATVSSGAATCSPRIHRGNARPWLFTRPRWNALLSSYRGDVPLSTINPTCLVAARLGADTNVDIVVAFPTSPSTISVLTNNSVGTFQSTLYSFVRDNCIDNGYIAHEFSHGVSSRIAFDGLHPAGGAQTIGMYEGWSDFFFLAFTQTPEAEKPRGYGTFWMAEPPSGPGVRSLPYSTDRFTNPVTLNDYNRRRCFTGANGDLITPCGPQNCAGETSPGTICSKDPSFLQSHHAIGEIWASALWDMYWLLAGRYGRSNNLYLGGVDPASKGDNMALQLVIDGLKLQPPNPSFLQARDPVLLADAVTYGGRNRDLIWQAFAGRGLGWGACDNWNSSTMTCGATNNDAKEVKESTFFPLVGTVSGKLFNDLNGDGDQDPGELSLPSWTVFDDANRNGIVDVGEQSTTVNTSGTYTLTQLFPGQHAIAAVVLPGWEQISPKAYLGEVVGTWDGSVGYTDVWGEGDFAFLGNKNSGDVDIIDLRLLGQPGVDADDARAARWHCPCPNYFIEDVQVRNGIGFFSADCFFAPGCQASGGVFVVDVSDPFAPRDLSHIESANGGVDEVHTLSVDGNFLYLASFGETPVTRVPVFNVANPSSPVHVTDADISPAGSGRVHDLTARGGKLYVCEFDAPGRIHIFDTTNIQPQVPLTRLGSFVSGDKTHSCWPTDDGHYLVVARETNDQPDSHDSVEIWDVSVPGAVPATPAATIDLGGQASSPHNPLIAGDILYVSWYEAGVLAFDIGNPLNPVQIGRHDDYTGPLAQNTGYWGVYPFLGQERVLATLNGHPSDPDKGLRVLRNGLSHKVTVTQAQISFPGKDFAMQVNAN
jgi:hypothetical protein